MMIKVNEEEKSQRSEIAVLAILILQNTIPTMSLSMNGNVSGQVYRQR